MQTAQRFWDQATQAQRTWILMICEIKVFWLVQLEWADLDDNTKEKIESFYELNWEE